MKIIASLLALTIPPLVLPACELESCTDLGCGPALSVDFAGGTWEPGEYEILVTADGQQTTCTATLPFASCEEPVSCDRSDAGFWVLSSGCALGPDEQRLDGVEWSGEGPAEVAVELRHDSSSLGSSSGSLGYTTSQPNGEDCEPVCQQADQVITLSL